MDIYFQFYTTKVNSEIYKKEVEKETNTLLSSEEKYKQVMS